MALSVTSDGTHAKGVEILIEKSSSSRNSFPVRVVW